LQQWGTLGWLAASTYVACGALRLARFNVQYEDRKRHFLGANPAAAEVIASLVLLYYFFGGGRDAQTHHVVADDLVLPA
jgi:CDP-diacylglycerol--serine O-phosphatidyltransferase